jgi:6-pyruvoyltetrahydropterin/6-carboxytetrahydropterin synthase
MRISATRKAHFNAAHRLYVKQWSEEKNREVFGPCSNPHFHGHNYELEVTVTGEVDPLTGYLIDLVVLKKLIKEEVEDYLDHKNLNEEVVEFQDRNPSAENICFLIYERLRRVLDEKFSLKIRLYETPRNYVEYPSTQ